MMPTPCSSAVIRSICTPHRLGSQAMLLCSPTVSNSQFTAEMRSFLSTARTCEYRRHLPQLHASLVGRRRPQDTKLQLANHQIEMYRRSSGVWTTPSHSECCKFLAPQRTASQVKTVLGVSNCNLHRLRFSQDHTSESWAVRQARADASFTTVQRASASNEPVTTFVLRNRERSRSLPGRRMATCTPVRENGAPQMREANRVTVQMQHEREKLM